MPAKKKKRGKKPAKKTGHAPAARKKTLSASDKRRLVSRAADDARSNPVFELRGMPVSLTPEHHDVVVTGLAARARVDARAPGLPASVLDERLSRLADWLAANEARGARSASLMPPLPERARRGKRG